MNTHHDADDYAGLPVVSSGRVIIPDGATCQSRSADTLCGQPATTIVEWRGESAIEGGATHTTRRYMCFRCALHYIKTGGARAVVMK